MRKAIALCLLAAFCTIDAFNFGGLDHLRNQVQSSKSKVLSKIRKLERLNDNTQFETKQKAQNKYIEETRNYNNYVNPTISEIRNEMEAAMKEGKNAQPCHDDALVSIKDISLTAQRTGDRCVKTAQSSIKSELNFIKNLITWGYKLDEELDSIFPRCLSTNNIPQAQICITVALGKANIGVRDFEAKADKADYDAKSSSNDIVLQSINCTRDVYSAARSRVTDVRLAFIKCIKDL